MSFNIQNWKISQKKLKYKFVLTAESVFGPKAGRFAQV